MNILEEACLPGVTDDEKKRLLSFVVSESQRLVATRKQPAGSVVGGIIHM